MTNTQTFVDFAYLEDMAEGNQEFFKQVLAVFMDNTPAGLQKLEAMVVAKEDFESIKKQAHFLKSSFSIVQVIGMRERLQEIETLAGKEQNREIIEQATREAVAVFNQAEPEIIERMNN